MPSPVDAYIAAQPAQAQKALRRLRATLRKALPGADESISYKIPMLSVNGAMVLYFAGFKAHCAIYPVTAGLRQLGKDVTDRIRGKASIHFTYDEELPTALITRIATTRAAEAAARANAKARPKATAPKKKAKKKTARSRTTRGATAARR